MIIIQDFEDLKSNWNHNFLHYSEQKCLIAMLKLFFTQKFFKKLNLNKKLFTNIIWQCIYFCNKNKNQFHNFKHTLSVVHSVNYFCNNLISVKRVFSEECFGKCYKK